MVSAGAAAVPIVCGAATAESLGSDTACVCAASWTGLAGAGAAVADTSPVAEGELPGSSLLTGSETTTPPAVPSNRTTRLTFRVGPRTSSQGNQTL
jgi:hypothetical protein